jgi:hypothetical protein
MPLNKTIAYALDEAGLHKQMLRRSRSSTGRMGL